MGPHIFPTVFSQPPAVVRVFQCSHAHPTQTFQHRSVEITQLFQLHFLGGNTSWITAHLIVPCSFCTSLTLVGSRYGPNGIFKMSFPSTRLLPSQMCPLTCPTDSEVSMGHLQLLLLLMVQPLLKSQQVSAASFLLPVISGRETLKPEGLQDIRSSSQANPAP